MMLRIKSCFHSHTYIFSAKACGLYSFYFQIMAVFSESKERGGELTTEPEPRKQEIDAFNKFVRSQRN